MNVFDIISAISQTSSTNEKLAILNANKDNELLKQVFFYAYNPRFNYWIKPAQVSASGSSEMTLDTLKQLDRLVNREVTGNAARAFLASLMSDLTPDSQDLLFRIVDRDLRCGASDTLAGKVWKGLVPDYPVMLCSKLDTKSEKYLKQFENKAGFNISQKEDGGRVLITVDEDGAVTCKSRNGSTLNTYGYFDSAFCKFPGNVFDGELIIKNEDGTPDRKRSNGIYTKLVRNTATQAEVELFSIIVWDVIQLDEYLAGIGTKSYSERWDYLTELNYFWRDFYPDVKLVYGYNVKTIEECFSFYAKMRESGQEGAVIKILSAVYENKRSKNCVKLKAESTGDFLCTGVEEGTGKYAGMIGALVCQSACGGVKFSVGTGLKDSDRAMDPAEYINRVVEVKYNELITSNGRNTRSLFLPVFVQIRFDKNTANTESELV